MNLIIDIGNTCVKMVCFNDGKVIEELRSDKDDVRALQGFCGRYNFVRGIYSTVPISALGILLCLFRCLLK